MNSYKPDYEKIKNLSIAELVALKSIIDMVPAPNSETKPEDIYKIINLRTMITREFLIRIDSFF